MEYKVSELASKAGVTKRTIHYYISKGLLMPPKGSGINSLYDDSHLNRILLIKQLQAEFLPLNKIRERILDSPDEIAKNQVVEQAIPKDIIDSRIYIRENVCDIFELHYSKENEQKYGYIIENVKKYVAKMLED